MSSETSKCRESLENYCEGNGIDIGFGGDPIVPSAITVDLEKPHTRVGSHPKNLSCDIRDLHKIFQPNSLDYIYSSHLLEYFSIDEIFQIYEQLSKILKINGRLIFCLPNQKKYEENCKKNKTAPNANHKIKDFSLKRFKEIIMLGDFKYPLWEMAIEYENEQANDYSFEIVLKKVKRWIFIHI